MSLSGMACLFPSLIVSCTGIHLEFIRAKARGITCLDLND
jgi:hypothetical protein